MQQYVDLVNRVLREGEPRADRTGVGTLAVFGGRIEFDLRERFPLVTVKETRWKTAFLEMLWFLRGETNTEYLHRHGCTLWDAWADGRGNLGPVYGVQWRNWSGDPKLVRADHAVPLTAIKAAHYDADNKGVVCIQQGIDQIAVLIDGLKTAPYGRRHIVSAWNVAELDDMALPPCHWAFQCYVSNSGELDMQVNQRSWDLALGAPFNIAQYALLLTLLARATGLEPRKLAFAFGDAHIYQNHVEAMREVVQRPVVDDIAVLAVTTTNTHIDCYAIEDFKVRGYLPHPFVKLDVAV